MDRILLGTRKGVFVVTREDGQWRPRLSGLAGACVNFVARDPYRGILWAAHGEVPRRARLSRSTDDGETWNDAPAIPFPPWSRYRVATTTGRSVETRDALVRKPWSLAFAPDGRIYLGTVPGGLFVSDDGGETFELNQALWNHPSRGGPIVDGEAGDRETRWEGTPASAPGERAPGIHTILVDPSDAGHVLVAVSSAGLFETRDGGQTWTDRTPEPDWGRTPSALVQCATDPDRLWQQNRWGVYTSDDGARAWTHVSRPEVGVQYGFPVAVDPADGRTAWVVPGRPRGAEGLHDGSLFVARTRDGGETWEQLRDGLPQSGAYDVVYRHALDTTGDRLAFGSTTGNVYVSEDRGERWYAVAHHLPPVNSVRFG